MSLDDREFFVFSVQCAADVVYIMWDVNLRITLKENRK